jgi:hypothetical protein
VDARGLYFLRVFLLARDPPLPQRLQEEVGISGRFRALPNAMLGPDRDVRRIEMQFELRDVREGFEGRCA